MAAITGGGPSFVDAISAGAKQRLTSSSVAAAYLDLRQVDSAIRLLGGMLLKDLHYALAATRGVQSVSLAIDAVPEGLVGKLRIDSMRPLSIAILGNLDSVLKR